MRSGGQRSPAWLAVLAAVSLFWLVAFIGSLATAIGRGGHYWLAVAISAGFAAMSIRFWLRRLRRRRSGRPI
jgi:cytochrome b subunit of formate dehydrogenase